MPSTFQQQAEAAARRIERLPDSVWPSTVGTLARRVDADVLVTCEALELLAQTPAEAPEPFVNPHGLKPDGKPMRALRSLHATTPANPMTEYDVWRMCRRDEHDTSNFHGALATLVEHGLAARCGVRRGYQWYLTDAGQTLLKLEQAGA